MIKVVVVVTAKPGKRVAIIEAFKAIVPAVRAEQGCIEYAAYEDVPSYGPPQTPLGSDSFAIVEKWNSVADLKAHAVSAHMVDYGSKVKDLIESRKVHLLNPV